MQQDLASLHSTTFDTIVIGGGITGVCIARELAVRGESVLLLERGDFGSGTSSATTKYLHGGIRYLERYDVALVRESLRERRRLALAAPHLVLQRPFVLPVWQWTKPGRFLLGAGAALYDLLSFDRNRDVPPGLRIGHPRWMGPAKTLAAVPWLQPDHLRGAVVITDTLNVHPERLLLALLFDAIDARAVAMNHTAVVGFELDGEGGRQQVDGVQVHDVQVQGVLARDQLTGQEQVIQGRKVVNAAGPWVGDVLGTLDRPIGPAVQPSKGVHFLTNRMTDVGDMAVLARARSGRHVVVSPWQDRLFVGPTDTPVEQSPDDVQAEADDVQQILDAVNDCRGPQHQLDQEDIDDTTIGIRPLISDPNIADSSKLSRGHRIEDHGDDGVDGLYSVLGGKWTTGRAIAEDVADELQGRKSTATRSRPAAGVPGWGFDPVELFEHTHRTRADVSCRPEIRDHLARLYGTRAELVLDVVGDQPELGQPVSERPGCYDILAQVVVAITHEGAKTLDDIVQRRLVLGTLGEVSLDELTRVAAVAAPLLGWTGDGAAQAEAEFTRRAAVRTGWLPGR